MPLWADAVRRRRSPVEVAAQSLRKPQKNNPAGGLAALPAGTNDKSIPDEAGASRTQAVTVALEARRRRTERERSSPASPSSIRGQPVAQAMIMHGGCLWHIYRPRRRSTRGTSTSRPPTASQIHLPAGHRPKLWDGHIVSLTVAHAQRTAGMHELFCRRIRSHARQASRGPAWPFPSANLADGTWKT